MTKAWPSWETSYNHLIRRSRKSRQNGVIGSTLALVVICSML